MDIRRVLKSKLKRYNFGIIHKIVSHTRFFMNLRNISLKQRMLFIHRRGRYVFVAVIFAVILLYHFGIATKMKDGSDALSVNNTGQQAERMPDLDATIHSKTFPNILTASPGGYYRVIVEAEASEDDTIHIFVRSLSGARREIGTADLAMGEKRFTEYVFGADDFYSDVVIERGIKQDGKVLWDDAKVYIANVRAIALNVRNARDARFLAPTRKGAQKTEKFYIPAVSTDGKEADTLSVPKSQIGNYFKADADAVVAVYVSPEIVGTGGSGHYEIDVREYGDEQAIERTRSIATAKFSIGHSLETHKEKNGLYRFELPAPLTRGNVYYVGITNKDAVVDEKNFLWLHRLEAEGKTVDTFFALDVVRYDGGNKSTVLAGATTEDLGDRYLYRYAFVPEHDAVLDINDAKGKVKYDAKLNAIVMNAERGAFYAYKFDFLHPLRSAHVTAKQAGDYRDEIALEYSFDGNVWQTIDYVQRSGEAQVFDGRITAGMNTTEQSVLLRVRYAGETRASKEFGLASLEVVAELAK